VVGSLWDDAEAAKWVGEVGARIYTSRLLGVDPDLVLHGGGNTSVKSKHTTVFGEEVDVLIVKGSGASLANVDATGFAHLRLDHVARLAELASLSDTEMADELLKASVVPRGPAPSVEAILHAVLPHKFVDHTHADAVVTLTNSVGAERRVAETYAGKILVVPYVMPGFKLAQLCSQLVKTGLRPGVIGVVLMNHGIITFGDSAQESYERMIELVGLAEEYVAAHRRTRLEGDSFAATGRSPRRKERAALRAAVSAAADAPVVMSCHTDEEVASFLGHPDLNTITQRGPITPDHVIRTKAVPLLGRDVEAYAAAYRSYFDRHRGRSASELTALDPAPRVILDGELGMCCAGRSALDAKIAEDIYRHTMKVILDATAIGGYQPISLADLFDMEYWQLEQAKLRRGVPPPPLAGEVALVTGAASGIGQACAEALMQQGAAVAGLDVDPDIKSAFDGPQWLGLEADVTDPDAVEQALERSVKRFGGLDLLVLNAGAFPPGSAIANLDPDVWRAVMAVNLDANALLLREAHPLLRLAPKGGRVVIIGSKNVAAPGPGAAAYSASKAALTQLARVAALEWGKDSIRVNVIHPNAVFDTRLWSDEILAERAAGYGISVEQYRTNNLLGTEVSSADVARLCVSMCGPAFAKTTGAQVPVDGGNDRVV
jgi:rhamnose utilization protein RhaD (predicted bifunctional aldolase and dehydrogenase)/NAD(P)-dependent dehydrogenase (short-subunit alcohol dehydrogenase family)